MDKYSAGDNVKLTTIPINNTNEVIILNVTFGDAYEYNYDIWNNSDNREDLNDDGDIGKEDFQLFLEETMKP